MRVIGGSAKGRRLRAPKGRAVRPTASRVKESLFNILPRDFSGLTVLDLFAGSGNLSIEALSRGAQRAILVDSSVQSTEAIKENLRRFGFGGRGEVWLAPAARAMRSLAKRGAAFDVIFLDPPYDRGLIQASLEIIARMDLLSASGLIVAEHSAREEIPSRFDGLILYDQRRYGDTLLSFFRQSETADNPISRKERKGCQG
jgi:16S rRNA (guanine(966)-N(2))-methyltransferase RsmD